MKSGQVYRAPLWYFKPQEGFLTIQDEDGTLLRFRNMAEAVLYPIGDAKQAGDEEVDLLQRARDEGWTGG